MSNEQKSREETELIPREAPDQEIIPAQPQEVRAQGRGGLIKSVGDFFGNAFGGGKNQDLGTLMEDFTSEMTLVAEGLSQDQDRLNERCERLEARQAEGEERLALRLDEISEDAHETRSRLNDTAGKADRTAAQLSDRLDKMEERAKRLETALGEMKKTEAKKGKGNEKWGGVLRQVTILAGILCGAWVITTIINKFF